MFGKVLIICNLILSVTELCTAQPAFEKDRQPLYNNYIDPEMTEPQYSSQELSQQSHQQKIPVPLLIAFLDNLYKHSLNNQALASSTGVDYGLQKRPYWKQCSFNAVACFGKK